jgi:hypothetical protein
VLVLLDDPLAIFRLKPIRSLKWNRTNSRYAMTTMSQPRLLRLLPPRRDHTLCSRATAPYDWTPPPVSHILAITFASMLERLTGERVKVVPGYQAGAFRLYRYTGSKWVAG